MPATHHPISPEHPLVLDWPEGLKLLSKKAPEVPRLKFVETVTQLLAAEIAKRRNARPEQIRILSYKRLLTTRPTSGGVVEIKDAPIVTVGCGDDGVIHVWVGEEDEQTGQSRLTHDIAFENLPCGGEDDGNDGTIWT